MLGGNFDAGLGLDASIFRYAVYRLLRSMLNHFRQTVFQHRGLFRLMCLRICVLVPTLFFRTCMNNLVYYIIIELQGQVAVTCECGNKPSGSIKYG